jgi:hypothetical protein
MVKLSSTRTSTSSSTGALAVEEVLDYGEEEGAEEHEHEEKEEQELGEEPSPMETYVHVQVELEPRIINITPNRFSQRREEARERAVLENPALTGWTLGDEDHFELTSDLLFVSWSNLELKLYI